tara:strand:+ start:246 stop:473 length:228 start_codon:yes stop_codon:yes gene_type:complete
MIKLGNIGSNMTLLQVGDIAVFFSYETPVACRTADGRYLKTEQKYGVTTSKHINKWLDGVQAQLMPQEYFNNLLA